jgi:predicted outer membrane repeat protein
VKLAQNVSGGSAIANYGTLTIQDSTLSDNGVTGGSLAGAALVNDGGTALVEGSTFSNNTIPGNLSVGGAIANQNGNLTIKGSTFSGNSAFDGGALRIASGTNVTVTQSTFEGNIAGYGGAIESWGTRLIVHDVRFAGNRATVGDGGAIWTLGGDLDIERSEFASNQATTTGGAISCYGDFISVIESAFGGNQADGHGGAVYSTCTLNMTNNTLAGNQAKGASKGGGALYHAGSEAATLQHVTIADNTAAFGAGIYNDGGGSSTLNISRSIVAHNPGGNCDGVITSDGYNLSNDNGCGAFSSPGDLQNANLPLGPLADNGGPTWTRMPLAGNQAIDAIPLNQCTATIDQRGVARPAGNGCDSGAVEGQATDAEWKIYLPLVIR